MEEINKIEPAQSILYNPDSLSLERSFSNLAALYQIICTYLDNPFNDKQKETFDQSFNSRITLLWGPPGTGKTTVLAGIILGWIEQFHSAGITLRVGVGSSNYNAIDNVLEALLPLVKRWQETKAESTTVRIARVRSSSSMPPRNHEIIDIASDSGRAGELINKIKGNDIGTIVVGGTWQQLGRLAKSDHPERQPAAKWFDLLVIDEASQVPVAAAGGYFLLLKSDGHIVLAGDHKQLGPIYGFQMKNSANGLYDCIFTYMEETHGISPIQLHYNYRTNIEISDWPKQRFYKNAYEAFFPNRRLQLEMDINDKLSDWPEQLPWTNEYIDIIDPAKPVTIISYAASTYTLSNPFEAQVIAAITLLYKRLLEQQEDGFSAQNFWRNEIGVVTPHRAQMSAIKNLLVNEAGMEMDTLFVDTVDRFQGQERDIILSSYVVADKDFIASEDDFILNPRRFNVTLTRARSKFIMMISDSLLQYLPADADVAHDAAHLQLFVDQYCSTVREIELPFIERGGIPAMMKCKLRQC